MPVLCKITRGYIQATAVLRQVWWSPRYGDQPGGGISGVPIQPMDGRKDNRMERRPTNEELAEIADMKEDDNGTDWDVILE